MVMPRPTSAETHSAGGAILRREGLYSSSLSDCGGNATPLQSCVVPKSVADRTVNAEIENVMQNHELMTDLQVMGVPLDRWGAKSYGHQQAHRGDCGMITQGAAARVLALALLAAAPLMVRPAAAQAANTAPQAGMIGPVLFVSDITKALKFYTDGLSLSLNHTMGPENRREYIMGFGTDPRSPAILLLHDGAAKRSRKIEHGNGYARLVLRMPDLDALSARLIAAGYKPGAIRDVAMGYRMMMVSDPDGYQYELVQIGRQVPEAAKGGTTNGQ